jgi:hypothetical protein
LRITSSNWARGQQGTLERFYQSSKEKGKPGLQIAHIEDEERDGKGSQNGDLLTQPLGSFDAMDQIDG